MNGKSIDEMKKLIRGLLRPNTIVPLISIALLGFVAATKIIPTNTLAILINGSFIAVCIMVNAAYGPTLLRLLRNDVEQKDQYLVTGILLFWNSVAASRVWSLAIIMAGKPAWMINHPFQTFCYFTAAASGFFFLKIAGESKVGYRYTSGAVVIAVMIATVILAFFET